MGQWNAGADVFDFGALAQNATETSAWNPCRGGENYHFALKFESAGAADVSLNFIYWLHPMGKSVTSTNTFDLTPGATVGSDTNDITVAVKANETTAATWLRYDPPDEIAYPFCAYKISVTENNVAACTSVIVIVCRNKA